MKVMLKRLKQALSQRQKSHIVDSSRVSSVVLVPIYYKEGQYYILFTKRTETVKEHKGQISFPGGACEKYDRSPVDSALRECAEEIDLAAGAIELLGELDDIRTTTSSFVISPFVAAIQWPYQFKIDSREVEKIIEIPISALLDKNNFYQDTITTDGRAVTESCYHYQGNIIWGATSRILKQFLEIWAQVMQGAGN